MESSQSSGDVRLVDVISAVWERIRFVLLFSAIIFIAMSVMILTDAPVYRAKVTLAPSTPLIDPTPVSLPGRFSDLSGLSNIGVFQARTTGNHAFSLLRSRLIRRQFIESENLMPILFADQWDSEKHAWRESNTDLQPTIGDALEFLEREVLFTSFNSSTGFISVHVEWSDPEIAAIWANQLVEIADSAIRERDIDEAQRSIQFLEAQVRAASLESIKSLMYKLIESHAKTIMVASIKDDYVFAVIDPAVVGRSDDTINMPVSFKLSLALVFALGCSMLGAFVAGYLGRAVQ